MIYKIENDYLLAEFNTLGAECTRIYDKENEIEYLWHADAKYWGRHAPVLFPIVGKLKDNAYFYEENKYQLSQHGFARDKEFTLFRQEQKMISFYLESDEETLAKYPFKFRLKITYTLSNRSLDVSYQIDNLSDDSVLYASVGGHPAFNIPFLPNTNFEDYRLTIKNPAQELELFPLEGPHVNQEKACLVKKPFNEQLTHDLFKNDALIYATDGPTEIELYHKDYPQKKIVLAYNHFDFIGIWSPYPKEAPFVCLEPWLGIADVIKTNQKLEEKFKIKKIVANDFYRAHYSLKFMA